MATFTFGSGSLWGVRTDVANATPRKFGTLQSVSVDFSANMKELFGQYQMPVAAARGQMKISGKAKVGQIMGSVFNDLFFGGTMSSGNGRLVSLGEIGTITGTADTIITSHATAFVEDLGVSFQSSGLPLTKVASAPATGQYAENLGTYTFSATDTGDVVVMDYTYSNGTSTGEELTYTNQLLGVQPVFAVYLNERWQSPTGLKQVTLKLLSCVSNKLSLATKQEDWEMPEIDFSAFADASNNVFTWDFQDIA